MPSDPRVTQTLDALAEPIQSFRSMLSNTSEQIRLLISTRVKRNGSSADAARAEFGEFAAGRIDPERMAKLFSQVEPAPVEHGEVVARALDVCNELLARRESLFLVEVEAGGDLRAAVSRALTDIGRAFAATRIVELVAQGQYRAEEHASLLDGHPFEQWSRAERKVDLAVVACVKGRDLRVGGLLDFIDRSLRLVLVVDGQSPPAPLVRLISPKVMVIQTADPQELEWIRRCDGPGVMALMPDGAAQFRHDPDAGPTLAKRMVITHLPEEKPRRLGVSSGFQQREDLEQLEAMAIAFDPSTRSTAPATPVDAPAPQASAKAPAPEPSVAEVPAPAAQTDSVDKLSAWLLEQTNLTGPS